MATESWVVAGPQIIEVENVTSLRVQLVEASEQVQPVPTRPVAVRPTGSESLTVTVPLVAAPPPLRALSKYVAPVWPCTNEPACDFVSVRSGAEGCPTGVAMSAWISAAVSARE